MEPRRLALALASTVVVAMACEEHFPAPLPAPSTPVTKARGQAGLDARPESATCRAGVKTSGQATLIGLQAVTPPSNPLDLPVEITAHDGKLYVVEQRGRVVRLADDGASSTVVLDVKSTTAYGGEAGMLGIAFHPKFATNGFVYVYRTVPTVQPAPASTPFQSAVERYHSNDGGLTLDPASATRIITVDQPYSNHNGGTIAFGNDGFLYWGLGDGGSGGDPQRRAQNKDELLGKMLRIDVDGPAPYGIPSTNPFAAGGGRPEIYALGLRNPYRFRFDPVTGDLWVGDVGQGAREEIDKVVLGGNYGWNVREGKICYPQTAACDGAGLIDPIVDHGRDEATTITGGVVYRGAGVPLLRDTYVYADFSVGSFWAIPLGDPTPTPMRLDAGLPRVNASAFAIDASGEIVFTDYGGTVYRIVAGGQALPEMPSLLSETGCVDPSEPTRPASGLFPYDVNVPQWDDGATSERWLSIPPGAKIKAGPDGRLTLPPGSIAMKTIAVESQAGIRHRRIETQLLLARPDASWDAYSYLWNEGQSEATLVTDPVTVALPSGGSHTVVDRQACFRCHSSTPSPTIGLEAAQLDRDDVDYGGGRTGNPLVTLEELAMIEAPVPRTAYAPLPRLGGSDTAERRARAYLHASCAHCHRGGERAIDLRFGTSLGAMHACNVPGTSKPGAGTLIVPGKPDESLIVRAMGATGEGRMPPVGQTGVHAEALGVVSAWIASLGTCN